MHNFIYLVHINAYFKAYFVNFKCINACLFRHILGNERTNPGYEYFSDEVES
jgi:hypothetical protein